MSPLLVYWLEKRAGDLEESGEDPKMEKAIKEIVEDISEESIPMEDRFKYVKLEESCTDATRSFADKRQPKESSKKQ